MSKKVNVAPGWETVFACEEFARLPRAGLRKKVVIGGVGRPKGVLSSACLSRDREENGPDKRILSGWGMGLACIDDFLDREGPYTVGPLQVRVHSNLGRFGGLPCGQVGRAETERRFMAERHAPLGV